MGSFPRNDLTWVIINSQRSIGTMTWKVERTWTRVPTVGPRSVCSIIGSKLKLLNLSLRGLKPCQDDESSEAEEISGWKHAYPKNRNRCILAMFRHHVCRRSFQIFYLAWWQESRDHDKSVFLKLVHLIGMNWELSLLHNELTYSAKSSFKVDGSIIPLRCNFQPRDLFLFCIWSKSNKNEYLETTLLMPLMKTWLK